MRLNYKNRGIEGKRTISGFIKKAILAVLLVNFFVALIVFSYFFFLKRTVLELAVQDNITKYSKRFNFVMQEVLIDEYDKTYCINAASTKYFDRYKDMSIFLVPISTIKSHLESIDCIASSDVQRVLPNKIKVKIVPKQPVAIWQHDKKFSFISSNGDVMKIRTSQNLEKFIIVTGDNAPTNFNTLMQFISVEPEVYQKIVSASWIGDRRWNIRFDNNTDLLLPEANPELSWHRFLSLCKSKEEFGDWKYKLIDFRVENKIYTK